MMKCPKCKTTMKQDGMILRCPKCGHKDYIDLDFPVGKGDKGDKPITPKLSATYRKGNR